jgi:O-antigen ligase
MPPRAFEYWYFALIFYAVLGAAIGVSVNFVGAGAMALLALFCALQVGTRTFALSRMVFLPFAFGLSYLGIQVFVFDEPIMGELVRPMIPWMLGIFVLHCLALRRGFLHRAVLAIFFVGLATLPFLTYRGSTTRLGLENGVSIANQNDLSAWFGFCGLYFAVVAIETRRQSVRAMAGAAAVLCFYIVAITVSRAPLLAGAIGVLVACRRMLKRGFLPFLSLAVVAWIAFAAGLFDESASLYAQRGAEDTGRFAIWPAAFNRFLTAPLTGFGASNLITLTATGGWVTPHNQFLTVAVAGGIVPLVFFIAYWVKAVVDSVRLTQRSHEDAPFLVPLLVYTLLIGMELNQPYMMQWAMLTLSCVTASGFVMRAVRFSRFTRYAQGFREPTPIVAAETKA